MTQYDETPPNYDPDLTDTRGCIVWVARMQKGKPYVYATPARSQSVIDNTVKHGMDHMPKSFDCSGLVWYSSLIGENLGSIFAFKGKDGTNLVVEANTFPGNSDTQMKAGKPITVAELQPGDFCGSEYIGGVYGHIAIYSGNGTIIEAAHTGTNIRERPFVASEWKGFASYAHYTPDQVTKNQIDQNKGDTALHGNPVDDVKHLVEGIANVTKAIDTFVGYLLKPALWRKIGLLLGGAIILLVAANELQKGL